VGRESNQVGHSSVVPYSALRLDVLELKAFGAVAELRPYRATKGRIYDLSVRNKTKNGKVRFFGLKVREMQAAVNRRSVGESGRTLSLSGVAR
jgi:hypothetical protein